MFCGAVAKCVVASRAIVCTAAAGSISTRRSYEVAPARGGHVFSTVLRSSFCPWRWLVFVVRTP
jgi:hypothetical protein